MFIYCKSTALYEESMATYWYEGEVVHEFGTTKVSGGFTPTCEYVSPVDQLVTYLALHHTKDDKTKVTINSMSLINGS
jgi:hypothetical protein